MESEVRTAKLKVIIALEDGKKQEFTMSGPVNNPDINLGSVMYKIERIINDSNCNLRAHTDIE